MPEEVFEWHGRKLRYHKDLIGAVSEIVDSNDPEEAEKFMAAYSKHAGEKFSKWNIGYISGYFDHGQQERIWDMFDVEHPVFGHSHPTSCEAFQAGLKRGRELYEAIRERSKR